MKHFILLLSVVLFFGSCINDDNVKLNCEDNLPPITQTGENTFGACIGNVFLKPRDGSTYWDNAVIFSGGGPPGETIYNEIDIHDFKSERTGSILIHLQGLHDIGISEYNINKSNGYSSLDGYDHNYVHCRVWREELGGGYYRYLSYDNSGIINITNYNLSQRLVSGTFNGKLRNTITPYDTIEIFGRFDFKWDTLDETVFP